MFRDLLLAQTVSWPRPSCSRIEMMESGKKVQGGIQNKTLQTEASKKKILQKSYRAKSKRAKELYTTKELLRVFVVFVYADKCLTQDINSNENRQISISI